MGLDFSARFIRIGVQLKERGTVRYTRIEEGELVSYHEAKLADLGLDGTQSRVTFQQADACNLKPLYTDYDLVLATNLIDRLYSPRKFLSSIHERIRPRGLLVIASPYSWDEAFTEKDRVAGRSADRRRTGRPHATAYTSASARISRPSANRSACRS